MGINERGSIEKQHTDLEADTLTLSYYHQYNKEIYTALQRNEKNYIYAYLFVMLFFSFYKKISQLVTYHYFALVDPLIPCFYTYFILHNASLIISHSFRNIMWIYNIYLIPYFHVYSFGMDINNNNTNGHLRCDV